MSFQNCKILCTGADSEKYHADPIGEDGKIIRRGDMGFPISSSVLRDFAACPKAWRDGKMASESKAMRYGSLLDCLALTPEQFDQRYAVIPPTYSSEVMECPRCGSQTDSKACRACKCDRIPKIIEKEWSWLSKTCQQWREAQGSLICVSDNPSEDGRPSMLMECRAAAAKLRSDPVAGPWGECSDKQVWIQGEWKDEETKIVIPVRCLIDYVPRADSVYGSSAGDLKSSRSVMQYDWEKDMGERKYDIQAAWNLDMLNVANGEQVDPDGLNTRSSFCFVVSENVFPYQVGHKDLDPEDLKEARTWYVQQMHNYCLCVKTGRWPGPDETSDSRADGWTCSHVPQWVKNRRAFEPKFNFEPPEPKEPYQMVPSDMPS